MFGLLVGLVLPVGCLDNTPPTLTSNLRLVNLVADASKQPLNIQLDGEPAGASVPFLGTTQYSGGESYKQVDAGLHTFTLKWATDTSVVVGFYTLDVPQFEDRTVYSTGGGGFTGVDFEDDNTLPAAGMVRARVLNLALNLGQSDVYVTSPTADLATVTPVASFVGIGASSLYFTVPVGTYRVRFVPAGTEPASRASSVTLDIPAQNWTTGVRTIVSADNIDGISVTGTVLVDR